MKLILDYSYTHLKEHLPLKFEGPEKGFGSKKLPKCESGKTLCFTHFKESLLT